MLSPDAAMLATGESIMLGRPAKGKKARVDLPEKGTTPESGGGTATKSRAVVTAATLAPLADSQPPRRLCKREPGHPSGPTAVARARARGTSSPATCDDWRVLKFAAPLRSDSSGTATCGRARLFAGARRPETRDGICDIRLKKLRNCPCVL